MNKENNLNKVDSTISKNNQIALNELDAIIGGRGAYTYDTPDAANKSICDSWTCKICKPGNSKSCTPEHQLATRCSNCFYYDGTNFDKACNHYYERPNPKC